MDREGDLLQDLQLAVIKLKTTQLELEDLKKQVNEPIAIIGMSCRFPGGANDPQAFWDLLKQGYDGITEIPRERWDIDSFYDPDPEAPGKMYVRRSGFLNTSIDKFDASFFGISPREAEYMDPQQRLILEVAWEALENSCIDPISLNGSPTGVFIGVSNLDYSTLIGSLGSMENINAYIGSGNAASALAGRLSYFFGLQGPCLAVDTACSSSLVALNSACKSLQSRDCQLALVGGVNIMLNPGTTIMECKSHMLSKDGYCKTFDAEADGFVRSEGCGVIVLKRLSEATRNHDHILGVIRATTVNQDGITSGFTVPNGEAQTTLLREALAHAKLEPNSIDYIEAHGTGTSLGDPIEVKALGNVFSGQRENPLWIGTVKTNVGHLEAAAGIVAVIKTVLALNHEAIPPHLHFKHLNPHISLDSIPAKIPLTLTPWQRSSRPRIAGVSSFGFSGTNAHAIIEEPPVIEHKKNLVDRSWHILTLSAKTRPALDQLIDLYAKHLPEEDLADIAFAANTGRGHFSHRVTVVAQTRDELLQCLHKGDYLIGHFPAKPNKVAFFFTGKTVENAELIETSPVFKEAMERSRGLYEYALFELWKSWGIVPDYVAGEGIGDIIAAIAAGMITLEEGLRLIDASKNPDELDQVAKEIRYHNSQIGFISSWTGQVIRKKRLTSDYWKPHANMKNIPEGTQVISTQSNWKNLLQMLAQLYLNGLRIDWKAFDKPYNRKKVYLPTYPFQREHYWVEALKTQKKKILAPQAHPLLGELIPSPSEEKLFRNEIDLDFLPYLKDHKVFGSILFPGAGFTELMHAAGVKLFHGQYFTINNLVIEQPLALDSNKAIPIELLASPKEGGYTASIYSIEEQAWILHSKGELSMSEPLPPLKLEWEYLQSVCQNSIDVNSLYNQFEALGLHYGKQFQTLRNLWTGNNEFIAELEGDASSALIDGSLQALASIAKKEGAQNSVFLPYSIDKISCYTEIGTSIRIHGKLTQTTEDSSTAEIEIFSYDGKPLMKIEGFRARRTNQDTLEQMLAKQVGIGASSWFYQISWLPKPLEKTEKTLKIPWLIVSQKEEEIEGLQAKITRPKQAVTEVVENSPSGILWFASGEDSLKYALELVQALGKLETKHSLYFITRGIQPVGHITDLENAPFNGFYKTLRQEMPTLDCRHIDLGLNEKLPVEELLATDQEGQVAYAQGIRYVPRLQYSSKVKRSGKKLLIPLASAFQLDTSAKGSFANLYLRPYEKIATVGPREVAVEVKAAGLNFRDVLVAMGFQVGQPGPLGGECAGIVMSVGKDVTEFKPGDRVVGFGYFASHIVAPTEFFTLMPPKLKFTEAAAIPVVFSTAYQALINLAKIKAGEKVLIHAAAGGVGLAAIQIAQQVGAEIYATASSQEKHTYLRSLGINHIYNSRILDYADEINRDTQGQGVDIVLNSLSGEGFIAKTVSVSHQGARFVEIGKRNIWSKEMMHEIRSDIDYFILALDDTTVYPPQELNNLLQTVVGQFAEGKFKALPCTCYPITDAESGFEYLQRAKNIGKVVLTFPEGQQLKIDPASSYLITGGLGGLGLKVAEWLAKQGAKHLVLAGRRISQTIEIPNTTVETVAIDISQKPAVDALMQKFGREWPELKGIIHAAGIIDDGILASQDWSRFAKVFAPKVKGSWNLHEASLTKPLDFFVLFSSIASSLGSPGQINYASANAYMDALAYFRQEKGLPSLAISWGPWAEVGLAAKLTERHRAGGFTAFKPDEGIRAFALALTQSSCPHVSIIDVNWKLVPSQQSFLSELIVAKSAETPILLQRLTEALPSERKDLLTNYLQQIVGKILGLSSINPELGFFEAGMDSLMTEELQEKIQGDIGSLHKFPATLAFDYPSIQKLTQYFEIHIFPLIGIKAIVQKAAPTKDIVESDRIAIIGLSCRFPGGANHPQAFWELLNQGYDGITEVPSDRWDIDSFYDPDPEAPGKMYARKGGFLNGNIQTFDADFFGISPREAEYMDPQQRLLLEVAWEALENSCIDPLTLNGSATGVFIGTCSHDYSDLLGSLGSVDIINAYLGTGNSASLLSGRLSFFLGLQGPSMTIDSACSSSLVTIHSACKSLQNGECQLALAGGVNLLLNPGDTIYACKAHMLAKDGYCKTFDAEADGFVRGEGCGLIVLKRFSDAIKDQDPILGMIRAIAVNQDGSTSGLTVPNGEAQTALIRHTLEQSKLAPDAIDYIEAHGTGTSLGDPIEVGALNNVFSGRKDHPLWLGTVKSNIGHLEGAAGVAGVIKTVLALNHEAIPRHLHFNHLNPRISLDSIPAKIPLTLTPWRRSSRPRIAGISSFGFSGTNAHAIIEEPPVREYKKNAQDRSWHLLTLSAKTQVALDQLVEFYAKQLPEEDLADIAFTANTGRAHFPHRITVVAQTKGELLQRLQTGEYLIDQAPAKSPKVAFFFTGQNIEHAELMETSPVFKEAMERSRGLYEYALFELWKSWGIVPDYVAGEGIGDIISSIAAGMIPLEEGLNLIASKDNLDQQMKIAQNISYQEPQIGFISSWTGQIIRKEGLAADYWKPHESIRNVPEGTLVISIQGSWKDLLQTLAQLYLNGIQIDWKTFDKPYNRKKVSLPTYPFQRERYWVEALKTQKKRILPPQAEQRIYQTNATETPILLQSLTDALPSERKDILTDYLQRAVGNILGKFSINPELGFFEAGMDSLMTEELYEKFQADIGSLHKFPPTLAFDYPSVLKLAQYFEEHVLPLIGIKTVALKPIPTKLKVKLDQIAIIGLSCRFPGGANQPQAFWDLLKQGYDGISDVPPDRWDADSFYDPDPKTPGKMYVRRNGFLNTSIDTFDADFFGISPREAEYMDPQQRLLLEVAWESLEQACINPLSLKGSQTGVFIGVASHDYLDLINNSESLESITAYMATGSAGSVLAGRLSYFLGLQGPSVPLDTACSSSLVALHYACKSLQIGECQLALAGGVNLLLSPATTIFTCKSRMLAKDGYCKTFDAEADGYVRSEGCGVIVLKRLSDAINDRDPILGVIRATTVNQDGTTSGITVPSGEAQVDLIRQALANADLEPNDIDYIEAHGTGTTLGDPIEAGALSTIFSGRNDHPLLLGTVKTNIGHLEAAAGIAGVIKTVLALNHEAIPAHIHFQQLNPRISLDSIPAKIPLELTPWLRSNRQRIAGVSAFGFSGTNAHAIIEESPMKECEKNAFDRDWHLLTLSAKTLGALDQLVNLYTKQLPEADLADIAFTANTGRAHFPHRITVLAQTRDELLKHLQTGEYLIGQASAKSPKMAFFLTGLTIEHTELLETSPVFKEAMDRSNGLFEYALLELWRSWGIVPDYVTGESIGDIIAAIAAGMITLEEGLKLIASKDNLDELTKVAQNISYQEPQIGFISSWTGHVIRKEGLTADYWKPHEYFRNIPEGSLVIPTQSSWKELLQSLAQLYLNGIQINWKAFDKPYNRKKVSLPTYPFQRERYWLEALKTHKKRILPQQAHPLLGEFILSPTEEKLFRNEIDIDFLPYLKDHQVFDSILFPGAGYAELMHLAGVGLFGRQSFTINNLVMERPFILNMKKSIPIELVAKPQEGGYTTSVYSHEEQTWILHAKGELSLSESIPTLKMEWEHLRKVCQKSIDIDALYNQFNAIGLHYGKQFQTLQKIWAGENEVIAELEGDAIPALIDGSLQAISILAKELSANEQGSVYLLYSIDQIHCYSEITTSIRIHGKLTQMKENGFSAEIDIFSYDGRPLMKIQGFNARKTNYNYLQQMLTKPAGPGVTSRIYQTKATETPILLQRLTDALPSERKDILTDYLQKAVANIIRKSYIDPELGFFEAGMDSLMTEELYEKFQADIGNIHKFPSTLAFDYPSVLKLAQYFEENVFPLIGIKTVTLKPISTKPTVESDQIAIIGLSCRFPGGANHPKAFWDLLKQGYDGISDVPPDRWDVDSFYDPDPETPGKMYVRRSGFLNTSVDTFDADFFGISPREAEYMDPQQRLLLEVAWESLEQACINPLSLKGSQTGVFIGLTMHDYSDLYAGMTSLEDINPYLTTGTAGSALTGRLSYFLGLQGPCLAIDTACSSSLVALNSACKSLQAGECQLALAGGVNIILSPSTTIVECKTHMLSKDGYCKTFDAEADGFVRGEGCGVVVLKRLSDAIRDQDPIFGVIRATAVNQDGASAGLMVPNKEAQIALIRQALANATLDPSSIDYIEAHGTGTSLGDPIEVGALGSVFGGRREHPLLIGSVKTNIGHLEASAGISGVIKTVLALDHEAIPPHLHFQHLNPRILLDSIPAKIPLTLTPWLRSNRPRIAGVSSFGFSGTNAHAIIEEPPLIECKKNALDRPWHLVTLSAKTRVALEQLVDSFKNQMPEEDLADIAFTANTGRAHFLHRAAVVAQTKDELLQRLQTGVYLRGQAPAKPPKITFVFTGQIIEDAELIETSPIFKEAMEHNNGLSEFALLELWKSLGIVPDYVAGDGIGDIIAVIAAGMITSEEGLKLIASKDNPDEQMKIAQEISYREPQIGFISSRTGEVIRKEGLTADYWKPHEYIRSIPEGSLVISTQSNWKELLQTLSHLYLNGVQIDWKLFDKPYNRKKVSLPTYPFQRERYWNEMLKLQKKRPISRQAHPLLGELILSPSEEKLFRNEIDMDFLPYLKDHQVFDRILFPGAGFTELMLAAGSALFNRQSFTINNLFFEQPLVFDLKKSSTIELLAKPKERGYAASVYSIEEGVWVQHAKGELSLSETIPALTMEWEHLHNVCQRSIDLEDLYKQLDVGGLHYGKQFQTLRKLWAGDNEVIAELDGDSTTALIDGSLQALFALIKDGQAKAQGVVYLPHSIGQIFCFSKLENSIRIHGKLRQVTDTGTTADIDIFSYDGRPLMIIKGFHSRKTNQSHVEQMLAKQVGLEAASWFYKIDWLQKSLETTEEKLKSPWLIVSQKEEYIEGLQSKAVKSEQAVAEVLENPPAGVLWFASGEDSLKHALSFVQALGNLATKPSLYFITRGIQPIGPITDLDNATFNGFYKTLKLEMPTLESRHIDLAANEKLPVKELQATDQEDQVAYRQGIRYVSRLLHIQDFKRFQPEVKQLNIDPAASYLITGGLGGLGLKVAEWLAEQGARHLVLASRRVSQTIEIPNVKVETVAIDISKKPAVDALMNTFGTEWPELKGIIHAAGVIDDGVLPSQDWSRFEKVFAPKIKGSWNLHEASITKPLEFFILFSSIVSSMGSPGQINYASANAYMDALACFRHENGLPALSICWGPWAEIGLAAKLTERTRTGGITAFKPDDGIKALALALTLSHPNVSIVNVDWKLFPIQQAFFSELTAAKYVGEPVLLQRLTSAIPLERKDILIDYLQRIVGTILGTTNLNPELGFFEAGMDSLMTEELWERLQADIGSEHHLPNTIVFDYPTITKMGNFILNTIFPQEQNKEELCKINLEDLSIEKEVKNMTIEDVQKLLE